MDTPKAKEAAWNANYGVVGSRDRRLAFSRQLSLVSSNSNATTPHLARSDSSISMPPQLVLGLGLGAPPPKPKKLLYLASRPMRRLALLLALNVAYSATELAIGLFTGRVGTRDWRSWLPLQMLQLFLLFLSFSLAVEALHAFMQDESEHKHYLVVSAVTNLFVNLLGVWFFRSYARVNIVYRNAEDMNYHSVCLHVLADSIRSAGLILASWFLSLGVENAEVLCLGIVSVAVFMLVLPLFKATGNILLQIAPGNVPPSAFLKCCRQITACEDVSEVCQGRFWELAPGHGVGSLSIRVKSGADDQSVLEYVHGLYQDLGIQDLTVQTDDS
ncbi:metal tolerance protein C2-like isoform X2 [Phragmites australis]|uniref:metal tolerance protein C2-like isoform X2 n=1 Tax=Phragmites australis TaxID=29695 RepID=UPI002D77A320|nr:metal tolerance protein C2-like isoform X2 [Phragmites australis]